MNKSSRKFRSRSRKRVYTKRKTHIKTSSYRRLKTKSCRRSHKRVYTKQKPQLRPSYRRRKTKSCRRSHKRVSRKRLVHTRVYKKPDGLSIPDPPLFKIVELEGCGYCNEAKKLIITKYGNDQLEIKKELSSEEDNEIRKTHKNGYGYFPKIFKYNPKIHSYEFIGGFDKLKDMSEFKK